MGRGGAGGGGADNKSLSSGSRQRVGLRPVVRAEEEPNPTLTIVLTPEFSEETHELF